MCAFWNHLYAGLLLVVHLRAPTQFLPKLCNITLRNDKQQTTTNEHCLKNKQKKSRFAWLAASDFSSDLAKLSKWTLTEFANFFLSTIPPKSWKTASGVSAGKRRSFSRVTFHMVKATETRTHTLRHTQIPAQVIGSPPRPAAKHAHCWGGVKSPCCVQNHRRYNQGIVSALKQRESQSVGSLVEASSSRVLRKHRHNVYPCSGRLYLQLQNTKSRFTIQIKGCSF